jgi:hypothetical protein
VSARRSGGSSSADRGCVVCADEFAVGDTVVRLPVCSHVFHERCALRWLERHNTCPMCRRELPAEDEEYEERRRARGRTHADDGGDREELDESQWEAIFG